jgi:hypothetical protein
MRRKAEVVGAVRNGLLTLGEVKIRWGISSRETRRAGFALLPVARIQGNEGCGMTDRLLIEKSDVTGTAAVVFNDDEHPERNLFVMFVCTEAEVAAAEYARMKFPGRNPEFGQLAL